MLEIRGSNVFAHLVTSNLKEPEMSEILENDVIVCRWKGGSRKIITRICRVKLNDIWYITDGICSDDSLLSNNIKDIYIVKR